MVYIIHFEVDGGCRSNGGQYPIGAAAAVRCYANGKRTSWTQALPETPRPTNQRAEIMAIKLALELALQEARGLRFNPHVDVTISSDSKYAIGCMNEWISKWYNNGWVNSAGNAVANRDLIEKASDLEDELAELGRVKYVWIPREQNTVADRLCNEKMDDMRREDRRYESDESSDYY